ncbi:MAG TPA: hypothetical protein VFT29_11170 [Gemmatimonadaceae bacterium]|nr:hypothetical protein [Gemmatimonadaceae bacterium]
MTDPGKSMEHLNFEQLSDLAERDEHRNPHVETCAECHATLRQVRELLVATHALPRELPPPPEAWSDLKARITAELPVPVPRARWWHNGWLASAAAIVLIAGTMTLTMRFTSTGPAKAKGAVVTKAIPAVLTSVDRNYAGTIHELRMALDAQRATLSPATVRTVENSLRIIDDAIAEARQALAEDPANQALADILAAHYERQVDLLRRATQLSSSL